MCTNTQDVRRALALLAGTESVPLPAFARVLSSSRRQLTGLGVPTSKQSAHMLARATVAALSNPAFLRDARWDQLAGAFPRASNAVLGRALQDAHGDADAAAIVLLTGARTDDAPCFPCLPSALQCHVQAWLLAVFPWHAAVAVRRTCKAFHHDPRLCNAVLALTPGELRHPRVAQPPPDLWLQLKHIDEENAAACRRPGGTCCVCLDDLVETTPAFECGSRNPEHVVCESCLRAHFMEDLYGHQRAEGGCVSGCAACGAYPLPAIRRALDVHHLHFVRVAAKTEVLASLPPHCELIFCRCGLETVTERHKTPGRFEGFACKFCGQGVCLTCSEAAHAFEPECARAVNARAGRDRQLAEALTDAAVCTCACGLRVVKNGGCNKMTCFCGRYTCFVCRTEILGYAHFCQCSLPDECGKCHLSSGWEVSVRARQQTATTDLG